MPNSTMFSDDDLRNIETIAKDLREQQFAEVKVKDVARYFYIHTKPPKYGNWDLVTESWVMAVLQYMTACGYEIKKRT